MIFSLLLLTSACVRESKKEDKTNDYKIGKILYEDDFNNNLNKWKVEISSSPQSKVAVEDNALVIDVDGGATVWLNKKLSGNILIEYKRKVIIENGRNDRLSDLNQFWMAKDPKDQNLFTRTGIFSEYDPLLMYYLGMGGNSNSTTRFRKYTGDGQRVLHVDLKDEEFLLQPNKEYVVKTIVYNGRTSTFVNDKKIFSFQDPDPLKEGYFGFRTTQSRHVIDDFKIYELE